MAVCLSLVVSAQKVYFIYLQTEDQSPFYVRMGDKIYSSATSGYLILPNLTDSTYYLSLGYAKSSEPEMKFSVAISQGDRGFLIKKFDDGPALFDFEEMSVVKASSATKDNMAYTTKTDNFSNLLSKAAGDPSLVKVAVSMKEESAQAQPEKKKEEGGKNEEPQKSETTPVEKPATVNHTVAPADSVVTAKAAVEQQADPQIEAKPLVEAKIDTTAQQNLAEQPAPASQQNNVKEEVTAQQKAYKPSKIIRRSESSTTEGFGVVYYDKYDGHADTIRILIPSSKVKLASENESKPSSDFMLTREKVDSVVADKKAVVEKNTMPRTSTTPSAVDKIAESPFACNNIASEKDFLKLRKKMVSKESDEDMIEEAKKEFKSKCYSVEQIKYLGGLFLTSAGRYQFFDAAYRHVSDPKNFASLQSELSDDYYIRRFKALIEE